MKQYSMLGLPGCVGSIDATFVPWDSCSANLANLCNGDKSTGLLYVVVVMHSKIILFEN